MRFRGVPIERPQRSRYPRLNPAQDCAPLEVGCCKFLVLLVLLTAIELRLRSNSLVKFNCQNDIARVTQGGAARENGLYISMHPRCETVYQRVPVRGIRAFNLK
jgi:hypothetical protein